MSEYRYGWEKLHLAVHSLAGNGSQAERLINAVVFNLVQIRAEDNLPEALRDEFKEFMEWITSVQAEDNGGNVAATINALDEISRSKAVEKIIGFYDSVCRYMDVN